MEARQRAVAVAGGTAAAAAAALGLLVAEGFHARRTVGPRRTVAPYSDGRYGPRGGTSYRLAVLGDSSAAGLGVADPAQTVGGLLATGVSNLTDRAVVLATMAVVGAQTRDLAAQVDRALVIRPHVAAIMIGANDVTHLRGTRGPVAELGRQIRRLRDNDVEVVMATCPDLGTVRPLPQPLRATAGRLSAAMAAAQAEVAERAGARVVPLAALIGKEFGAHPERYFADDGFHPSAAGYAAAAAAILPSVLLALDQPQLLARLAAEDDLPAGNPGLPSGA